MQNGITTDLEHVLGALDAANMAWWELEFPSGALKFSKKKTEMLGYDAKDFVHYRHFTDLIHPDDYDDTMRAMSDHYTGKAVLYETKYRIKGRDGNYRTFYDKGRIVERTEDSFIVAGIVTDVTDLMIDLRSQDVIDG